MQSMSNNQKVNENGLFKDNHPAGAFMWSAALGGPVISWLAHRKALNGASFLAVMFAVNFLFGIGYKLLHDSVNLKEYPLLALPFCLGYIVAVSCTLGVVGAKKIKNEVPNYNEQDYRRREKWGSIFGAIYTVIMLVQGILETVYAT